MQYFFNDLSKISDRDSTLNIAIAYKNNFIEIKATSDSIILKDNWYNISHYSPYFKAFSDFTRRFGRRINSISGNDFGMTLCIPIVVFDPDINFKETISWKNFNNADQFSSDKKSLLIFWRFIQ
ncbi:hypothetical protein ACFFWB_27250 [Flavobacterium procerum]|uniref:hypothetical protein n=1 Tax=Flavobacterium procerum TaxID=1455569 RepID=UPI0035E6D944